MAEQAEYKGFARVEINGHNTHIGYVTTEAYGQAVMFRIDRPEIPEREDTLTQTSWVNNQRVPAGTIVRHPKIEAVSVLVGAGSIYRIIPCTEELALKAIVESESRPLILLKLPASAQLAAAAGSPFDQMPDYDEEDLSQQDEL